MGYSCRTLPTTEGVKIKKENLDKAFHLAKELNGLETEELQSIFRLKHGFVKFNADPTIEKPKDSKSNGNPNVSFRFVPWNYDGLCADIFDIFKTFGFETKLNDNGDIVDISFPENNEGDESALLGAIAPCVEEHDLYFVGEDGALWFIRFLDLYPKGFKIFACNELAKEGHALSGLVFLSQD